MGHLYRWRYSRREETFAGWRVIARSPHGRIDFMFDLVITTDSHLAFSCARTHSNTTVEMTAMIEALSFLARLPVIWIRAFILTPNVLLVCVWARSSPHSCSAGACMSAVNVLRPTLATAYHATRARSHWESG